MSDWNLDAAKHKAKAWRHTGYVVVDLAEARHVALAKLNGIDRLVLGLSTWLSKELK